MSEVIIGGEQPQVMFDGHRSDKNINGSCLNSFAAANCG